MLELTPFLYSPIALGVIFVMVFIASSIVLTIPVFATRGKTQVMWLLTVGFLLTVEAVVLVVLAVLNSQGKIL